MPIAEKILPYRHRVTPFSATIRTTQSKDLHCTLRSAGSAPPTAQCLFRIIFYPLQRGVDPKWRKSSTMNVVACGRAILGELCSDWYPLAPLRWRIVPDWRSRDRVARIQRRRQLSAVGWRFSSRASTTARRTRTGQPDGGERQMKRSKSPRRSDRQPLRFPSRPHFSRCDGPPPGTSILTPKSKKRSYSQAPGGQKGTWANPHQAAPGNRIF